MNKPELEAAFNKHLDATAYAVIHSRDSADRSCLLCESPQGQQHRPTCQLWPLISSRIGYRMAQDRPPPVMAVLHTDTVHVYRRRA